MVLDEVTTNETPDIGSIVRIIKDPYNTTIYDDERNVSWSIVWLKGEVLEIIYPSNTLKIKILDSFLNNPIITVHIDTVTNLSNS
tara:strand:- start:687 stop:941 length:255 start_codon:yes stop_codon:yes gene_type:complete